MSVRRIYGIGPLMAQRLKTNHNIRTRVQLRNFILGIVNNPDLSQNQKKIRLETFVNNLTRNPRYGQCLEGNIPRIHNKMARDGLIRFMMVDLNIGVALKPTYYDRSRKPPRIGDPSPRYSSALIRFHGAHGNRPPVEGGPAFPHGPALPTRPGTLPPAVPFGKSQGFPAGLRVNQRNAWIRDPTDPHSNRQYWPCDCFRSRETCQDFAPQRQNRRLDPTKPFCTWDAALNACRPFLLRRSTRKRSKSAKRSKSLGK